MPQTLLRGEMTSVQRDTEAEQGERSVIDGDPLDCRSLRLHDDAVPCGMNIRRVTVVWYWYEPEPMRA